MSWVMFGHETGREVGFAFIFLVGGGGGGGARGNLALDLVTHRDLARSNTVSDLFSASRTRINSEGYQ